MTAPLALPRGCGHWMLGTAFLAAVLGLTTVARPAPRLVWNASASAPVGLYGVRPRARLERGAMVIAWTPRPWRALAAVRHYLPENVPLVKRVAALAGDRVCAAGTRIAIDGHVAAMRVEKDAAGRTMPWWEGCRTLQPGEVFLLMADVPGSFDGRYFGVTGTAEVIGRAYPLWLR